jgi:hypothetical protein
MSIRSIIAAALRGIARMVVVTTEIVVAGVRMIVTSLVPASNTGSAELAQAYIGEEPFQAGDVLEVRKSGTPANMRPSEADRVKSAAKEMRDGRRIPASLLDPERAAEREILKWLSERSDLELGMIARAPEDKIAEHINGKMVLMMRLLPAVEAVKEEQRETLRPPTISQWVKILTQDAADHGDDDPDFELILERAQALADAGCTLHDYRSEELEEAPAEDRVIDDREDVG